MSTSFRIGEFHVEPSLHSIRGPAGTVRLEPKVMLVLVCLAERRNEVVPKDRLIRSVWPDTFVSDDVLTRAISELRRVFGDDVKHPRVIETIPKSGYRLITPVFNSSEGEGVATESHKPRLRARTLLGSSKRGLAAMAIVAAAAVIALVSQWMTAPRSGRIVRLAQVTFTGHIVASDLVTDLFPAIATDGGRVYFTQNVGGTRLVLGQSSLAGGEIATIPTPLKQPLLLNVSPDGSRLLVRELELGQSEGPLWVIPTVGGAPLRLGAIVAHDGAWSPDGTRLAYASAQDLYLAGADGGAPSKLATTPGRAVWLRWSPDGAHLRFTVIGPHRQTRSIWEVSAEGHDMHSVPLDHREPDLDCCGDWSPDGRHFFFLRYRDGRADVWATRERKRLFDGTAGAPVRLTEGPLYFPALAPARDGRQLLVVGGQGRGGNIRFDLRSREYARYNAGGWGRWFAVSRDGVWIAHVESGGTKSGLWRSRVDGSEQLPLTPRRFWVLLPRWSPDGTRIAFMGRTSPQQPWKIYVVPTQGGEPQVVRQDLRFESDPDWSPDGESLMFGRPPDFLAEPGVPKAIHIVNLRTKVVSTLPGSEGLFGSRWSPSGRYVAALSLDLTKLLLFDFHTHTWTELGRFTTLHNPVWSRDERFLYFEIVDEVGIYRLRVTDHAVERIADLRGVWASDMDTCSFEGLGPDDSPLISCFRDDRDIYALDWEMR